MKSETDKVFSALADPTRRKVIELLHDEDTSVLDMLSNFSMSFQALNKHVKILEDAGIVSKVRVGKFKICSLNQDAFKPSLTWISYYANFWDQSFDRLENLIKDQQDHGNAE